MAVLAAGACAEQSRVDAEATVVIAGAVVDPAGATASDRPVRLGTGVTIGDGAFAVLTAGLACTTGACTGNVRDTTTDAGGRYSFTLQGKDTQSTFGEAESVLVSATGSPTPEQVSGPLTSARFRVQTERVELPTLQLVDPGLTVEASNGVTARWTAPRAGPYELTFENGLEVPVWLSRTADGSASVDPRVLEDTSGQVVVSGGYEEAIEGSPVEMRWRSPGAPYAAGAGAPPSRGRPCRYVANDGLTDPDNRGCGLTDGDLASSDGPPPICPAPDEPSGCQSAIAALIDLDPAVPAELIVVRGCEGSCVVEVSPDGTAFRSAGAATESFGAVALDGQPIRTVRVALGTGTGLREVSVWGPAPESALRSLTDRERGDLAEGYGGATDDDGVSPLLLAVSIVAAVAALVLVAAAYRRQRARELT